MLYIKLSFIRKKLFPVVLSIIMLPWTTQNILGPEIKCSLAQSEPSLRILQAPQKALPSYPEKLVRDGSKIRLLD